MEYSKAAGRTVRRGHGPLSTLLAGALLTLPVLAQEVEKPHGAVRGVITDASGAPVTGAIVEVYPSEQLGMYSARTYSSPHGAVSGPDGRFELRHVKPDEPHRFVVRAEGLAPALLALPPLEGGQILERDVVLEPGGSLTVRVIDEEDRPLEDLVAYLFLDPPRTHLLGDEEPGRAFSARTDAMGRARFDALPPGYFTLVLRPPGFYQAMVVSPELPDAGQAATVDLGTLVLERAARLAGRVVDDRGQPVSGARITIRNQHRPTRFTSDPVSSVDARTDRDGRFDIAAHTRDPTLDLVIEHAEHPRLEASGFRTPASAPVEIVLARGVALRGKVVNPEGGPVYGAAVRLSFEPAEEEGRSPGPPSESAGRSGGGGVFVFRGLAQGVARLYATAEGWAPSGVVAVELDKDAPPDVTLTLQPGSVIDGSVGWSDGRPVAKAVISLSSKDPAYRVGALKPSGSLLRTEDDGSFRIGGLAPGRYELTVYDPEHSSDTLAVEKKELVVEAGDNVLEVVAPVRARVGGLVVDGEGRPVPQARMELHSRSGEPQHWIIEVVGRDDGSFVFPSIPPGTYSVSGWSEGFGGSSTDAFEVGRKDVDDLVLRLGAAGSVAGRIFGVSPGELARVQVEAYGRGSHRGRGEVSPDGTFRITSLEPGRWRILARTSQWQLQRRVEGYVDVRAHEQAHLDLEFPPPVRLTGRVHLNGSPVAGLEVRLDSSSTLRTLTGDEGHFTFDRLQPKQYSVTLLAEGREIAHREMLIEDDSTLELDVETGSLSGTAVDENGAPVVGAAVRAMWRGTPLWLPWNGPRTDAAGRFEVRYAEAGPYEIFVEAEGYESASRRCSTGRPEGCEGLAFSLRKAP